MEVCSIENWISEECSQKKKRWWAIVSILLVTMVILWIMLILYLLLPQTHTITNRQILLQSPQGKQHLLFLNPVSSPFYKVVGKQEYIDIYDLRDRSWKNHALPLSFIPSFQARNSCYLLDFNQEKQTFSQIEYNGSEPLISTAHPYSPWTYFFREFAAYLGFYSSKTYHYHVLQPI